MNKLSKKLYRSIRVILSAVIVPFREFYLYVLIHWVPGKIYLRKNNSSQSTAGSSDDLQTLKKAITKNYCLLDLPDHVNIGDHLITIGTKDFLNTLHSNCSYVSSSSKFDPLNISSGTTILLQGGGNFGDIWIKPQLFKEKIVKQFPDNKIIILPQTIYYTNRDNLEKTVSIYSKHKDLTICARDHRSYTIAKENFKNNTVLLIPDMASFSQLYVKKDRARTTGKILYINRDDQELKEKFDLSSLPNLTVSDWPTFNIFFHHSLNNKHLKDRFFVNEGIYFLSDYDLVISARMHGSILANLLDIPTILIDNSYGKCKTLYETWHKTTPDFYLAENKEGIKTIIERNFPDVIESEPARKN